MKSLSEIQEIRNIIRAKKCSGKSIGLVPTMGALHEGHLSLLKRAKEENNITVCSIYVNPIQFDNSDDLGNYPKTIEKDKELLENIGCDILFLPSDKVMYPASSKKLFLNMNFGALESCMEGKYRKGHFNGVGIVVSKLFNIIEPSKAYFGQKDLQQYSIIKNMGKSLFFDIKIISCPIVREVDGLAMSSRNTNLTPVERKIAPLLHKILSVVKNKIQEKNSIESSIKSGVLLITEQKAFTLEYLEVVNVNTLQPINSVEESTVIAICLAAYLGSIRLIDNIVFEV